MDPDPDSTPDSDSPPDPVSPLDPNTPPDSTHFFSDFQDAKKNYFSYFLLVTYLQALYFSVLKIKFFAKILC
jgi:hypothetical protein